uniref:RING-type domain-containing protein n=1 Tax=Ditylenchus dipsaci TaxID=166011 RepID=A0A915DMR8_9BILA
MLRCSAVNLTLDTSCAVCIDDFELDMSICKLKCGHSFHFKCIEGWLAVAKTCPVCRSRVIGHDYFLPVNK